MCNSNVWSASIIAVIVNVAAAGHKELEQLYVPFRQLSSIQVTRCDVERFKSKDPTRRGYHAPVTGTGIGFVDLPTAETPPSRDKETLENT